MWTRHLLQKEGKWKKQVQAQRHVAAPVKVPILLPLILMVKLPPQRHCSPQTLQTAITQKPSSSSPTEQQSVLSRGVKWLQAWQHPYCLLLPFLLWLTGCYRKTSVALEMYFSHTFLALYFHTFPSSVVWYHWI